MIDETLQDQAALYVLRLLPPAEAVTFAQELERNDELRVLVAELGAAAAQVSHAAPVVAPPPALRERVLASIRTEKQDPPEGRVIAFPSAAAAPASRKSLAWIPWAIAASVLLTLFPQWMSLRSENEALRAQTVEQGARITRLERRDELASVQIASLSAKVSAYEKAFAVVVYDPQNQRGLVKLDSFPKAANGKDYQLWVIEPGGVAPVSAGLVPVGNEGIARVAFKPEREIRGVDAFAISVEPAGGSAAPRGEIVFVGK